MSLIVSSTAYSQKKTEPVKQRPIQKHNISKGQLAPFDGVLLSRPALAKIISGYENKLRVAKATHEHKLRLCQLAKDSAKRVCAIRLASCIERKKSSQASDKEIIKIYRQKLQQATQPPPWYVSPYLHLFLGCAACGGICVGSFSAASNMTQGK